MYAIKEIAEVENNMLQIQLPIDFPSKKVEIIILPFLPGNKSTDRKKAELPELITIEKENYASQIILEERR